MTPLLHGRVCAAYIVPFTVVSRGLYPGGSPAGRLQDAAARILAAGTLPRCPRTGSATALVPPGGVAHLG